MNFYIKIVDGNPVDHPVLEENLLDAFGQIPENYEPFRRIDPPYLSHYEKLDTKYMRIDGIYTDVHSILQMTNEEKYVVQQKVIDEWNNLPYSENFSSWTFNADELKFEAPTHKELSRWGYDFLKWNGKTNQWQKVDPPPKDGNEYYFDYEMFNWVQIV